MNEIEALLDELTPSYDGRHGDWARVRRDAGRPGRLAARTALVAVVAAAGAGLVLAWPFGASDGGVLDRALAAVGDGPVLHVVLRGDWGGTLVDLQSGARTPVYGEDEIWFDRSSGEEHRLTRLGGTVIDEEVDTPSTPPADVQALGSEYRQALASGTARVTGTDTLDGEPVAWITIHSESLPDVADGKDHEWAQQVAVSTQTYRPVALRETRDGVQGPGTLQRVLEVQLLPGGEGDFTTSTPSLDGTLFRQQRDPIAAGDAAAALGATPLWLGAAYDGRPLATVYRETRSSGRETRVRLTGDAAAAATHCAALRGSAGADCLRGLGLGSVEVTPAGAFVLHPPTAWSAPERSVDFDYGDVAVSESTEAAPDRPVVGGYTPPAGSVFVAAGGGRGYLQQGGLQVEIDAPDEATLIAAAHALEPMP
jgi:hypothetical protein